MKTLFIFLAAMVVVIACSAEVAGPVSEYFSKKDLKIITSSYNQQSQTRSVLYGNPEAVATFKDAAKTQKEGAIFKLYTYKEQIDPVSYDSNVKSTLVKTESVTIINTFKDSIRVSYKKVDAIPVRNNKVENAEQRIAFIANIHPANSLDFAKK